MAYCWGIVRRGRRKLITSGVVELWPKGLPRQWHVGESKERGQERQAVNNSVFGFAHLGWQLHEERSWGGTGCGEGKH